MTHFFKCPRCGWCSLDEDMRKLSKEVDEFIQDLQKHSKVQEERKQKYMLNPVKGKPGGVHPPHAKEYKRKVRKP